MRVAYFDTISGVSGDMTLGAFISAGVPLEALRRGIAALRLEGVELEAERVERSGIGAIKADVVVSGDPKGHRHLADIIRIIGGSELSDRVKKDARKIFDEVASAEAKIHGTTPDKVHFHEVGMLDSIVDIVGAAICMEEMGIERVYSSPVKVGSGGFVDSAHGPLPVPGPAAMEILRGYPIVLTGIPFELTTPTGAAIIKALSSGVLDSEQLRVASIGYGAGSRVIPQAPNLLRVLVGDLPAGTPDEELLLIEANIDDMNPEIYPHVIERLLAAGANDAYLIPIMMKKGRPGTMVCVLAGKKDADAAVRILFSETTTIGVRMHKVDRRTLPRESREVKTSMGNVRVKVIAADGGTRVVPEYEECRRIAVEKKLPLVEVYRILERELSSF